MAIEPIIDPARVIVDPHHHLWLQAGERYLLDELLADLGDGHDVRSTVYVECESMYRQDGPAELRSVGEVEFAAGMAAMAESGAFGTARACAGIVGFADLRLTQSLDALLAAHEQAAGGRLRGVRHKVSSDPNVLIRGAPREPHQMRDPLFREGLKRLAARGLSLDVFPYHTQLAELLDLARATPEATIILDHVGGPLGCGSHAGRRDEIFAFWRGELAKLACCPNVLVKLGGLGMPRGGFGFDARQAPASSEELAAAWRPYVETAIELFGPGRSMFESNYPADKPSASYRTLWNALKRIAAPYSETEKQQMFAATAARAYRLPGLAA